MSNLLRPVSGLGLTTAERVPSFRKVKEIKGLHEGILKCAAQEIPQIDAEIAEKGHLWIEISHVLCMGHSPQGTGRLDSSLFWQLLNLSHNASESNILWQPLVGRRWQKSGL